MRLMAALVSLLAFGAQNYPPPYPRAGTKALIENERVTVWDYTSGSDPGRGAGRGPTPANDRQRDEGNDFRAEVARSI